LLLLVINKTIMMIKKITYMASIIAGLVQ